MIEISLGKLVLLALVALIVLGPEKLPGAARTAGALLRRIRTGWDSVRAEVERELEIEEIKRSAREAVMQADAVKADVKASISEVREPFVQAAAVVSPKAIVESMTSSPSDTVITNATVATPVSHVAADHAKPDAVESNHIEPDHIRPAHVEHDPVEPDLFKQDLFTPAPIRPDPMGLNQAASKEPSHGDA